MYYFASGLQLLYQCLCYDFRFNRVCSAFYDAFELFNPFRVFNSTVVFGCWHGSIPRIKGLERVNKKDVTFLNPWISGSDPLETVFEWLF
jgi:hypothetical protein